MNFRKYFDLIVLVIFLEIICNSSANEWKKLKRKLIALTLLHSIRVKTWIPLPFPIPLPVVFKKDVIPVVLPPKRVPFLVPKPVPYYQVVPNFVPIYAKETDSHEKDSLKDSGEDSLSPSAQLTYEDYLIPSPNDERLNPDFYKLSASDVKHPEWSGAMHNFFSSEHSNKPNIHQYHNDKFIDPFEQNAKHKFPKNRKFKKQNLKHFNEFKGFDNNQEKYEDLDMVSTAPKTEPRPQEKKAPNPYNGGRTQTKHIDVNDHRLSILGHSSDYEMNKQIPDVSKHSTDKNRGNASNDKHITKEDSPGVKTNTKKVKIGEIRLRHDQLKALFEHNSQTIRRQM